MHRKNKKVTAVLEEKKLFKLDVSEARDWSYAMANLIEAEVHLHKSYVDTKKEIYLDLIEALRKIRQKVFEDFMRNRDPGIWCWSKHMLSLMMELSEVASKELDEGRKESAKKYFELSQKVLELFVATVVEPGSVLTKGSCEGKDLNTEKKKR